MRESLDSPSPIVDSTVLPWAPVRPGFSLKVLRAGTDDDPRVLLLRLEPGAVIPRHRHEGDVHAMNLSGRRELHTGEIVGPGGYVYEPPGNVDSWRTIGDEPVIVLVVARGALDYLGDDGRVLTRSTTSSTGESYRRFVEGQPATAASDER